MNYSEPCDPYVTVKNTHTDFEMTTMFDCNVTLDRVRDELERSRWMRTDNYFLNKKFVFVDKTIEEQRKLQGILVDDVLSVGRPNNEWLNSISSNN